MFLGRILTDLPPYLLPFNTKAWTIWLLFMMFSHQFKVTMAKVMLSVGTEVTLAVFSLLCCRQDCHLSFKLTVQYHLEPL